MKIKEILKKIYIRFSKNYSNVINDKASWVITSYISEPFYMNKSINYMKSHQNKKEVLIIDDVFTKAGLNHLVIRFDKPYIKIKKHNCVKIIFGIEPNFEKLVKKYPDAIKIYYATGSYYKHQNNVIKERTDEVNEKKNATISYSRLVKPHESVYLADHIIQIGSDYTIETYPENIRNKIIKIRQSTYDFIYIDLTRKKLSYSKKDYLWFGSKGAVLKGLDLLLDYFSKNENINLHIVGPIEKDFEEVYYDLIYNKPNIKYYGYLGIDSDNLHEIAEKSTFVILPSSSEGGVPGSVLNMMKLGLIPIVSKNAAFDNIQDYGILINEVNYEGISQAIIRSQQLDNNIVESLFTKCNEFVVENYNATTFESDFRNAVNSILKMHDKC